MSAPTHDILPLRRRPLVGEVRDAIVQDFLASDDLGTARMLPSEKQLCERYGVSRVTLRTSMHGLQEAGRLTSRHGVGWMTVPDRGTLAQGLDQLCSLETFAAESGQSVTTAKLEREELVADERLAAQLEITAGDSVLAIRRVKLLSGTPVAWLLDFVPSGRLPFATLIAEFDGSVLDVLLAHPEVGVKYADTEVKAVNLPEDIAARLKVRPGTAGMFMETIVRSVDERAVELAETWLVPEHFRLRVRRRPKLG